MKNITALAVATVLAVVSGNSRAESPTSSVRRVVTTLDRSGKSVVLFDTAPPLPEAAADSGPVPRLFWKLDQAPATISPLKDLGSIMPTAKLAPVPGGAAFSAVDFPPTTTAMDQAAGSARPPGDRGMHRTKTIDFAIVMSGEIDMVLDDSTVHLKTGDVVVQQETNHAWVNHGKEICRIAFVQLDASAEQRAP